MAKGKKIKLLILTTMILISFGIALPEVYSYSFRQSKTTTINLSTETELKSQSTDESDIEKLDRPAYFNIFNIIFSFLPGNRSSKKIVF